MKPEKGDSLTDNAMLWEDLEILLHPQRQAVGIKFLYTDAQYEASDAPQLKAAVSYCNMVRLASQGKNLKATAVLSACPGGRMATGLEAVSDYKKSGCSYDCDNLRLYATVGLARKVVADMQFMENFVYGVELRPLKDFSSADPDVVIMVVEVYAVMRLIQAYSFHYGLKKDFRMTGNQAFCSELTATPYLLNDINFSALCSGTRHICNWSDHEAAVGIPYSRLSSVVDGLWETLPETEPQKKKEAVLKRAAWHGREVNVQPGREYFTRQLKTNW
jgi:uncharacterized protein (DUF169 family)